VEVAAGVVVAVRVLLVEVLALLLWLPLVETGLKLVEDTIPSKRVLVHCGFAVVLRCSETFERGTNPKRRTQRSGPAWKEPPEHDARGSTCGTASVPA
jgi:hypothetical protein